MVFAVLLTFLIGGFTGAAVDNSNQAVHQKVHEALNPGE